MKEDIVIFGGSGFLGRNIISKLKDSCNITVATRNLKDTGNKIKGFKNVKTAVYSQTPESAAEVIEGNDVVINLSGASIAGKRWNEDYKSEMYGSRINTTRLIVSAFGNLKKIPRCFISSSATGVYGNRYDEVLTENSAAGDDFLANMCIDWENEALKAEDAGIRVVCIRTGVVLDKKEGGFSRMAAPFRFFLGGTLGSGNQYFPWVHIEDIAGIYAECVINESLSGVVNGSSPSPVTNREFSKILGRILGRPSFFPVPEFVLKIAVGELAEFLVASQRVYPEKLLASGYKFKFNDLENALRNLLD